MEGSWEAHVISGDHSQRRNSAAVENANPWVGVLAVVVLVGVVIAVVFALITRSDDSSDEAEEREATHRTYCQQILVDDPRRRIGFTTDQAFIEDCIRAQLEYDRVFGDDAE